MPKLIDLTGKRFGFLTVLGRDENLKLKSGKPRTKWICRCDCGTIKSISSQSLIQGTTLSCGCYGKAQRLKSRVPEDLTGQRFGKLTVVEQSESVKTKSGQTKIKWACVCDCGKRVIVLANQLRSGRTKSCGCYRQELLVKTKRIDLTGKVFGKLTVIKSMPSRRSGESTLSSWLCKCECGNIVEVTGQNLRRGNTTSCGCTRLGQDLTGKRFGSLVVLRRDDVDHSKWVCVCDCGKITKKHGGHLVAGSTISCGCKARSKNEAIIANLLEENNVHFLPEYSFKNLKRRSTNGLLRFDFAIFDADEEIVALIEYQGPQHFLDLGDFGKMQREETDELKRAFCTTNNIKLYEILYSEDTEKRCKEIIEELSHNYMLTPC